MKKLTLSADPEVIEQAKRIAQESGTSVSALFERMVRLLARKRNAKQQLGPITRKATGLISLPRGKSEKNILDEALNDKYGTKS